MRFLKPFWRKSKPYLALAITGTIFLVVAAKHTDAHKPVTSKYEYNRDVFPLLQEHCSSCHVKGGSAPMSLMTYNDAVPWAESIRDEVTAGRMPPWPVDPTSSPVKGGYPISSSDLEKIVVWASGGTPQGDTGVNLAAITYKPLWKLGQPDLKISTGGEHVIAPGTMEEISEFSLPVEVTGIKWVKAADLMPGTPSIVRDAIISIENGPVLALWEPGANIIATPSGAAFRLAPGSKIHLQVHYKKHFDQEGNAVSDKSTIGLYFTDPPLSGRELQSFSIDAPPGTENSSGSRTFAGELQDGARIIALRPTLDRAYDSLEIDAITPSGKKIPLLRLHGPRPQWSWRYWLQEPVELARGSKVQVRVTPLSYYLDEPKAMQRFNLQVALDYVPE